MLLLRFMILKIATWQLHVDICRYYTILGENFLGTICNYLAFLYYKESNALFITFPEVPGITLYQFSSITQFALKHRSGV